MGGGSSVAVCKLPSADCCGAWPPASPQDFRFPDKTVLVVGREKEGIPADVLAQLHDTVEIPQLGLIRSLNVHVSGAIAAYEYTRQQLEAR